MKLTINGKPVAVRAEPNTPLLWVLRDELGLLGTKFGCGIAACGACTVLVDGEAIRSCVMPVSAIEGKAITTIEGLANETLHPLQRAWLQVQAPQCGYCQSGMLMASAALLQKNANPSDQDIDDNITNICRCGTYPRVRAAIHLAAKNGGGKV
ncbi:MAG: isoquinoline 1-oxidoreductase subunit alpha [Pseudomonadota bacterium]|nr:isoquinoline 1-oxidoreductase subunit alpha [Pseudomonadota bacterium]